MLGLVKRHVVGIDAGVRITAIGAVGASTDCVSATVGGKTWKRNCLAADVTAGAAPEHQQAPKHDTWGRGKPRPLSLPRARPYELLSRRRIERWRALWMSSSALE